MILVGPFPLQSILWLWFFLLAVGEWGAVSEAIELLSAGWHQDSASKALLLWCAGAPCLCVRDCCFFVQQSSMIEHSLKCMFITLWVLVYSWSMKLKGGQEKLPSPLLMFHGAQTVWEQIYETGFFTSGWVDFWLPTSSWYSHRCYHYFYIRELKSLSFYKGETRQFVLPFHLEEVAREETSMQTWHCI